MKPIAAKYLEKAERAIQAAVTLMASETPEFATGRAYYAMFYATQALLYERGIELRKHGTVHSAFGEQFIKTGLLDASLHRWLLNAYDDRILGDYGPDASLTADQIALVVEHARAFLSAAQMLLRK